MPLTPAIRVEQLGKKYRIGGPIERYRTLRDTLSGVASRFGVRLRQVFGGNDKAVPNYETFWALKDVSFEIQVGDVVGIVGRNGAGKSTLLKILSRITEPTEGRVEIRGRVGSLLEVGTGFHPELTGRENVYLNGAILGMKRTEVDRKFDDIVAFAEVDKFIDTPVKHYSSGMYVRLAFSVAAHLDPEVLLIDEVLAVGDVGFQAKCFQKIREASNTGRTVLIVSHNLSSVEKLCSRAILLSNGRADMEGTAAEVIAKYVSSLQESAGGTIEKRKQRGASHNITIDNIKIFGPGGTPNVWVTGKPCELMFSLSQKMGQSTQLAFTLYDFKGAPISHCTTGNFSEHDRLNTCESNAVRWYCPELPLAPGKYFLNVALYSGKALIDHIEMAATITVTEGMCFGRMVSQRINGVVVLPHVWES